ncbi:MAG: glycosyltransferase, partial [Candidatus Muiribacteriota bacterium]
KQVFIFMKITQLGKYYYPFKGGIENHLKNLTEMLVEENHEVKVIVFNSGIFSSKVKKDNFSIVRCGKFFELFSTPFSLRMLWELLFDKSEIIHLHAPNPSAHIYLSIALKFKIKKPKIVITHHSDIVSQKFLYKIYKPMLQKLYAKADAIIVATEYHIKYSDILKKYENKVKVIPYGINIEEFGINSEIKKRVRKVKKSVHNKKIVLFTGRLVYYKGVSNLIDAFKQPELNEAVLIVIGTGPYYSTLKAQGMENENIIFIPEADDMQLKTFLHACSVFVLPSTEKAEAFGIVQLEAMACHKPVISTNLDSGAKSININNETGYIVEPGNPTELKEAVLKILNNAEKSQKMGENAYEHVKNKYSSRKCMLKIMQFYKEL